jgi:CheY-like chemotaxis protein
MNILLVDDRAKQGWQEIIQEVLSLADSQIQVEETVQKAIERLSNESFDLIFLDLRFGEEDHNNHRVKDFGGYKILKSIKSSFGSLNFPTPVVLFTATNKMWNIDFLLNEGVDNYYIKEHPNHSYDVSFSRQNYKQLKNCFPELIEIGKKRRKVWKKIQSILNKGKFHNDNIKLRIEQKLKIGYGILFRDVSEYEERELLFNQEVIAFIVFWSILEEICKDSFKNNWDKSSDGRGMKKNKNWIFRNDKIFIENNIYSTSRGKDSNFKVGMVWNKRRGLYEKKERVYEPKDKKIRRFKDFISLRDQIWAVLLLYKDWDPRKIKAAFPPLRKYRNKIDFIHSSNNAIFNENLRDHQDDPDAFKKVFQMLGFSERILVD